MFTSFSIQNFRGFSEFSISSLAQVNLIAGANDVGKTALLEAIFLLLGESNVGLVHRLSAFRGLEKFQGRPEDIGEWFWTPLFHKLNTHTTICIQGQVESAKSRKLEMKVVPRTSVPIALGETAGKSVSANALRLTYTDASGETQTAQLLVGADGLRVEPPAPPTSLPGYFLSARKGNLALEEDAKLFGDLIVLREPYDLLAALRLIEPKLMRLSPIPSPGGTIIYGDVGLGQMLPLTLLGDGLGRLASIVLRLVMAPNGVVLVDEIENGLHYSVLAKVWAAIAEATQYSGAQVFATTHSWECARAAHEAFSARDSYDFRLHRLEHSNGIIRAVTYDQKLLTMALANGMEVR
jgi:hypothetical protein